MSVFLLALAGAVIPCLLWLWFFYSRDKYDPEPIGLIVRLFLIGALPVAFIAGVVNTIVLVVITGGDLSSSATSLAFPLLAIAVAPFTEEGLKYLGTNLGSRRHPAFNEPLDGIIYGTTVGLGFAAAETTDYLIGAYMGVGPLGLPIDFCAAGLECFTYTVFLRGLGSALLHATAGGIAGYAMSRRKEGAGLSTAIGWLAVAAGVHALWNALSFLVIVIPLVVYGRLVKRTLARSPFLARVLVPSRYYDPTHGGWTKAPSPPPGWRGGPPPPGSGPPVRPDLPGGGVGPDLPGGGVGLPGPHRTDQQGGHHDGQQY